MQRTIFWTFVLLLGSSVFVATVFGGQIAGATGKRAARKAAPGPTPVVFTSGGVQVANTVKIDPANNGVSVTNTDNNGNVKVHEQGTANVNVTNSSLPVAPAPPITGGGDIIHCSASVISGCPLNGPRTATALQIVMTSGIVECVLENSGGGLTSPAVFSGPADTPPGDSHLQLALSRPVEFTSILAIGGASDSCTVSWIGSTP